ncbi:hypothetical protein DB48_17515 [Shewanella sp. cp20]|nr:hypothetical protein DB48_17515 [Shewanella sp. cp20]
MRGHQLKPGLNLALTQLVSIKNAVRDDGVFLRLILLANTIYTNHSKHVIRNSAGKTLENKAGFLDK